VFETKRECVRVCMCVDLQGGENPKGCLKLQVFFHKRAIDHRALFRKLTHKDKASYATSPPCTLVCSMCVCEVVGAWMRGGSKEK